MMKSIKRAAWLLLTLLLLAAAALGIYAWRALPQTQGRLALPGLQADLSIERDEHGIPTIRAANLHDLMFGLGVAHAQDRLWQLETHRRIGAGRLAEAFGEGAAETDVFLRSLGVRRAAEAQWARSRGESRLALEAYAAGINAVLRQGLKARPPEFWLLGVQPEDWTPVDSLAWSIMMAWDLGANWSTELLRLRLAQKMPKERIDQLLPPPEGQAPLPSRDYVALYRSLKLDGSVAASDDAVSRLLAAAPPSEVEGVGSNNWVVAGSRSQTGRPLLANDPHLKLTTPALWYFARLEAPGYKAAGATLPGLPGVVLGQNAHVAWGFTNTGPDVQDLYLERVRPDDAGQYQTPEGWARFETRQEVVRIKGRPDRVLTVRSSRHGPVISDTGVAEDALGPAGRPGYVLALRWTALDADSDPIEVQLGINRADSVDQFVAATRGWVAPMQNMVVADDQGHIGFIAPGRVPVRRPDNDLKGLAPAPGWDARYDWDGWLPFDALPQQRDPERGWIATANARVVPADYPYYLNHYWALPYRQRRIEQLLDAQPRHGLADLRAIQADVKSLGAPRLLPWLLKSRSAHALAPAALQQLAGFDGSMGADRAAPLIFWAWTRQLSLRVLGDELGPLYDRLLGQRGYFDSLESVLARDDGWWCDDKRTVARETCAQQVDAAFDAALDELQALQGPDPGAWRWGAAHQARSEHRPFSRVKALARFFELRTPVGGDSYTVNVARVNLRADPTTGEFYLDEHGPSLRGLYDLADPAQSRVMHSSGQSGLPWSPHFDDFVRPWAEVDAVPLWPQGKPAQTLTLQPQR